MVKQALRLASRTAPFSSCVSLLERWDAGRTNLLQVLTYHRIDTPERWPDLSPTTISATPDTFERQMSHLASHYRVVSMAEVLAATLGKMTLPPRSVLLTFDDAYRDFEENAWPILKRHGFPATLFVPTAFPGDRQARFWWDTLYAALEAAPRTLVCSGPWGSFPLDTSVSRRSGYERVVAWLKLQPHERAMEWVNRIAAQFPETTSRSSVLSWDELRRLAGAGITLCPHTRTHPLLNRVSGEVAHEEIAGSLADLRHEVGEVLPVLAYPAGKFNGSTVATAREAGIQLAFAGRRGNNALATADPLRLRRNHIGLGTNQTVFRARLLSWSRYLNRLRPVTGR